MEINQVAVGPIKKNRAQMRRVYDLHKLAELTLQMFARGFDGDKPILVRRTSDGGQEMIRGHRRRMAVLMAQHLAPGEWDVESVFVQWQTLVGSHDGDVETAIEKLAEQYGDTAVPAVYFEGDAKQAVLDLWSDNYGDEKPDPLGVAASLVIGIREMGISPAQAAAEMGQTIGFVESHLALGLVNEALAQRLVNNGLSLTIAVIVASLEEAKREALTRFIMAAPDASLTVAALKRTAKLLKELSLEMPLSFPHSARRNVARAFLNLWHEKLEQDAAQAYLAAAIVLHQYQEYQQPWDNPVIVQAWLRAMNVLVTGHWAGALEPYLTAVSCETCPIANLPKKRLKVDITSPAALPCRMGATVTKCLHGLAPDDPFHIRVPMAWAGHEGVQQEGGTYFCTSFIELRRAYEAQNDLEKADAAKEKRQKQAAAKAAKNKAEKTTSKPTKSAPPSPTPTPPPAPVVDPVVAHDETVAAYMGLEPSSHFMATNCARCQHLIEDDEGRRCAWMGMVRPVKFTEIKEQEIVVCRQYAPSLSWREILPEHPQPGQMPRDWLVSTIEKLVNVNMPYGTTTGKPFEWLTGRPLNTGEYYHDWFPKQFQVQRGDLSYGQLYSLFVLAVGEWQRASSKREWHMPVDGSFAQMVAVTESDYEPGGEQ